ncbi:hypothetical protein COCCADRAFT_104220, partial [Bipolaris zeicola 26-R-13]
ISSISWRTPPDDRGAKGYQKKSKVVFLYAQTMYFDEGIDSDAHGMSRCRAEQILKSHHQGPSGQ